MTHTPMPQPELKVIEGGPSRQELKAAAQGYWPVFGDRLKQGIETMDGDKHVGPYILILMALWYNGGELPNIPYKLAAIAQVRERRFRAVWKVISEKFEVTEKTVSHHVVQEMLQERYHFRNQKRTAGALGGRAKAKANRLKMHDLGLADAVADAKADALASPSPIEEPNGSSLGAVQDNLKPPKKKRRKPSKSMPDDWVPDIQKAQQLMADLQLTRQEMNYSFQQMKGHANATDRKLVDWDQAFGNWIRKSVKDGEIGPGSRSRKTGSNNGSAIDDA
jgi:uncharacterized protein YdaU (DUF1376 family)